MSLIAGTRLGPYEILSLLGAGGMGEVYRARDTRLDRTVAVKVLAPATADDPDFLARFEREAKTISQFTHPHICVLHDVGQEKATGGSVISYLVMEYLDGQTLAARLEKGPLPLDQALKHAADIADALDKAHRQGIVHRDLKPANVMMTKAGVKLLDFGLAKPRAEAPGGVETHLGAPPARAPLTATGSIIGTFQYMAPEQLEGKEADTRSDVWAFGCVLYEMVTGKRAFEGTSQASLIGAILNQEPPAISSLTATSPPSLDRVVRTCLAKDPDDRWQNAHDLANELRWIAESASTASVRHGRPGWLLIATLAGGLIAGAALASLWWSARSAPVQTPIRVRALAPLAPGESIFLSARRPLAISPDGRVVAYTAVADRVSQIHIRPIDQMSGTPLGGTERGDGPFFSPNGQWVGFFVAAEGRLKKVALSGGAPVTICEAPDVRGASWGTDDRIVFTGQLDGGLMRVAAGGGTPEALTQPNAERREKTHRYPDVLANGKGVIFTIGTHDITSFADARIAVYETATKQVRVLLEGGADARYQAPGYLLYGRAGNLMAVPFDADRLAVTGTPVPVLDGLLTSSSFGWAAFGATANGVMAHVQGAEPSAIDQLTWVDRTGRATPVGNRRSMLAVQLSPNREQALVRVSGANDTLWIHDFHRGDAFSRLTFRGNVAGAVWTPDGRRIIYNIGNEIASIAADGSGDDRTLFKDQFTGVPTSITPDGKTLLYQTNRPGTGWDIWALSLEDRKARPVLSAPFTERFARLSPDGRWIAYTSNESGRDEVYVRPFPALGSRTQVSRDGGAMPLWSPAGTELYFRRGQEIFFVAVRATAAGFDNGAPQRRPAPDARAAVDSYDITSDGRLLVIQTSPPPLPTAFHLILGWLDELKGRVTPSR